MREKLTHFDEKGNAVMVDVSEKEVTSRVAVASGKIRVNAKVMEAVKRVLPKREMCLGWHVWRESWRSSRRRI